MDIIKDRKGQAQALFLWGLAALILTIAVVSVGLPLLRKGASSIESAKQGEARQAYKDANTGLPCTPVAENAETCMPTDQSSGQASDKTEQVPETRLSPEEERVLEHKRYCTDTKPTDPENLKTLQLICTDLCGEESFKSAHPGICKPAVQEQPSIDQSDAELQ